MKMTRTRERWKAIPGYPKYQVSDFGHVRRSDSKKLLTPSDGEGRLRVNLCPRNSSGCGSFKTVRVHRLVLLAFRGYAPVGKPLGTHRDGNSQNNRLANLRWGSKKDNAQDSIRHGTWVHGERFPQAKLSDRDVLKIRALTRTTSRRYSDIGRQFGVTMGTIYKVANRISWKHI